MAPSAGRIDGIMFKPGESVTANVPVVSIVPDGEVKVRIYVPQTQVNAYKPGRKVVIGCDGCATGMTAIVDFVASRPEYTPPVIGKFLRAKRSAKEYCADWLRSQYGFEVDGR